MMEPTKEKRVHQVFEKISNNYDKMNSVISFKRHIAWRRDVMKRMNVEKGAHALDVCTGTGDWAIALGFAAGPAGKIIGLDFSDNMLHVAREKKMRQNMKQLEFIHGNAMDLPFPDNSFDYVTIGFGLRNVADYETALREMYRVVKPGGKVVCLETSQPKLFGFKQIYYFYFQFLMPMFGKILAKSRKEYAWLHESARHFPDKNQLTEMFLQVGFKNVEVKGYTGGVAAMHLAVK